VIAERMALSRLTIHTACFYIDRLVILHHFENNLSGFDEKQMRKSTCKNLNSQMQYEPKKIITPRQKIELSLKNNR
jgi:hypothetical protein